MDKINYDLLNKLTNEEKQTFCKYVDLEVFLTLLKKDKRRYDKYIKVLGRLERRSVLVQKLLPKYAFDLYQKGDEGFTFVLSTALGKHRDKFIKDIEKCLEPAVSVEDIKNYNTDDFTELFFKIKENSDKTIVCDTDISVFISALKLNDVCLSDEIVDEIRIEIKQISALHKKENEYKAKLELELRKNEKVISQKYEYEKEQIEKTLQEVQIELNHAHRREQSLNDEIEKYKTCITNKKERLIEEWRTEFDKEIVARKKAIEEELQLFTRESKEKVEKAIKKDAEELKQIFENEFENEKMLANKVIIELKEKIVSLEQERSLLEGTVLELNSKQQKLKYSIKSLEKEETYYFQHLKERVLNRKLDEIVFLDDKNKKTAISSGSMEINSKKPIFYKWQTFSEVAEESLEVNGIEDFIQDFCDNLALNFENVTEIALLIIAAFFNNKVVIVEDSISQYIVESLSQLIDGQTPLVIEYNGADERGIIEFIRGSEEKVIYIGGVLNKFDEVMFSNICRQLSDQKYIFFGISQIQDVPLFSKNILSNAFVLDVEDSLIIADREPILVGNNNIEDYKVTYQTDEYRKCYEQYFKRLVSKKLISKKLAFDLSKLLCTYLKFMSSIGDVVKKCILHYLQDTDMEDAERDDLLERTGWK